MFKTIFQKIIYYPFVNRVLIKLSKVVLFKLHIKLEIPPSGKFVYRVDQLNKICIYTNQTSWVTKYVYYHGIPSFEYSSIFIDLIKNINVFLDIGANIGYYSMIAKVLNPEIEVHAFEPASGPLHYLQRNVGLNQAEKIVYVHDVALSDSEGEITFYEQQNPKYKYLKHNLGGMSSETPDRDKNTYKPYQVKTTTLDAFTKKNKIKGIELMKLDTEGTEDKILEFATATIKRDRPIIICETLFNRIEDKLEAIMKKHDYLFFNFKDGKLTETNTIIRKVDDGVRDCFFVPPEKRELISKYM